MKNLIKLIRQFFCDHKYTKKEFTIGKSTYVHDNCHKCDYRKGHYILTKK